MAQVLSQVVGVVMQHCNTEPTRPLSEGLVEFATLSFVRRLLQKQWKFLEAGSSTVTVVNQRDYDLTGTDYDCGRIMALKYDGQDFSTKFLDKEVFVRTTDTDEATNVSVVCWTIPALTNRKNPKVRFWGTPQIAGKTIEYWYKKIIDPNDPMAVLPADMVDLVQLQMLTMFAPNSFEQYKFNQMYKEAFNSAWATWKPEVGLPRPILMTQETMRRNYARNRALMGNRGGGSLPRVVNNDGEYL